MLVSPWFGSGLLTSFLCVLPLLGPAQHQVPAGSASVATKLRLCRAEDATANTPAPKKTATFDYVPLVPGGAIGYWQVYSTRSGPNGEPIPFNNVGISVVMLTKTEVLVFGAGYGSLPFPPPQAGGVPLYDAAFDMAMVNEVIRQCMRLRGAVTIDFVTPHGHLDHVNAAAFAALRNLGYGIRRIVYHEADSAGVLGLPDWTSADLAVFEAATAPPCALLSLGGSPFFYQTSVGRIAFISRPGHTPGSIDMVIDVLNDPTNRHVVQGSVPGSCGLSGVREVVSAHGNAILGDD